LLVEGEVILAEVEAVDIAGHVHSVAVLDTVDTFYKKHGYPPSFSNTEKGIPTAYNSAYVEHDSQSVDNIAGYVVY
jgi:hypothetical protein